MEEKMAKITIKDLLEAGVHFGHQTKRWNPKMKEYVFGARNGISIIDLTKTIQQIADACNFLQHTVMDGGKVLFVGTKRQAQELIKEAADKTEMFHVSERWLGGTLTNNVTIRRSVAKMEEIDKALGSGEVNSMKKKEVISMERKSSKLHRNLDGIARMKKQPDVVVLVDVCHEDIAVREAVKLKIPIVAIVDTNGDPDDIDYPIAANDDAVRSIKIIIDVMISAINAASELYHKKVVEEKARKEAEEKAKKEAEEKARKEKAEKAAKEKEAKKAKAGKKKADEKKAESNDVKQKAKKEEPKKEEPKAEKKADKAEVDKEVKEEPKAEAKEKTEEKEAPKAEKKADKAE
jgi:small subunit ribosomal protein S2